MAELDLDKLSTSDLGYTVDDEDDDDPVLLHQDGNPVDTWRERYPYDERLSRSQYEREQGQWYFQRYVSHLPGRGEMVLFDRSWYNRAGVEKVMGFCTPEEHAEFLRRAPLFEDMLVSDGISLTKLWFSVSPGEQRTRFAIRQVDPVRQWKLSPTDIESLDKWDAYTDAKEEMFEATDTDYAPWIVVKSNDKKRARINAMRHLLSKFDYDGKDHDLVGQPDPQIVGRALAD
jgi:polyphosphate kinase